METQLAPKIAKQNKHAELQDEINALDDVVYKANDLLAQIRGEGSSETATPPRPVNSLATVLEFGAQDIRDKCANLHTTLDAIKLALF